MKVKLLMNWDIKPGRDQEYFEFTVREWIPGITNMGLKPSGAWFTMYSRETDNSQIMTEVIARDFQTMRDILDSDDWQDLHTRLQEYVNNYRQKIVRVTGGFQI